MRTKLASTFVVPSVLSLVFVLGAVLAAGGCRKRDAGAGKVQPLMADPAACNSTAGAVACPPDAKDPSGRKLPATGGVCALPSCKPCGSASAPAFRDAAGAPKAGWCMCIPKSDDSGDATYSCFSVEEWAARGQ